MMTSTVIIMTGFYYHDAVDKDVRDNGKANKLLANKLSNLRKALITCVTQLQLFLFNLSQCHCHLISEVFEMRDREGGWGE